MRNSLKFAAAGFIAAFAATNPCVAQNLGPNGHVPGGITLVPGTVVTPLVSGSAVTGTVPLAGTIGSAGVQNFDPQLGTGAGSGTQYPIAPYSQYQLAPVFPNQSALPQALPATPDGVTNGNPPAVTICPSGVTSFNGLC